MAFRSLSEFKKTTGGRAYTTEPSLSIYGAKASSVYLSHAAAKQFEGQEYVCVLVDTDSRKLYVGPAHKGSDGARKWNGESFSGAPLIARALGLDLSKQKRIHVPVSLNGVGLYAQFPPTQG